MAGAPAATAPHLPTVERAAPARLVPADVAAPPPRPLNKQALPPPAVQLMGAAEAAADDSSEYETESSDSEEEAPAPLPKPVFVSRRERTTQSGARVHTETTQRAAEEKAAQKRAAHDLAAERVLRELQEKEHVETHLDVEDTDGLDPDAEFAAWRARELTRVQRVQDEERARNEERAAIAQRRALPEAQRFQEDMAHARATRQGKQRGQQGFMQKYYHKGAFFQVRTAWLGRLHKDMDILQRDYTESTADAVDKTQLPKVLQVRDFGKRSRSKWTYVARATGMADADTWRTRIRRVATICACAAQRGVPHSLMLSCWTALSRASRGRV